MLIRECRGRARGPPFDCRLDALPVARCYFIRVTQNLWLYSSGGGGCLFVPDERIGQNLFLFYAPVDKRSGLFIVISPCKIVIKEDFHIRKDKNIAYFDYDKLAFPLTLRTWKEGDWFIPFGMKGRKKLSDYFSDHKFSRLDKERTWLLCSGGAVIWIVGERSDNRFCLDKTTKSVLVVNFFPTKSESN